MADVWVLLLVLGFFVVCVALVRGCDHIIGGDDSVDLGAPEPVESEVREVEPVGTGT